VAATLTTDDVLRRKERVVAAADMPGIPAGTPGKVAMVSGLDWVRYWVRFDNGVVRGSLDRSKLARPGEPVGEERAALLAAVSAPAAPAAGGDADGEGGGGAGSGEGHLHAGVLVPAHLLERSKKRREVLGA
jgi:hypothetical protein